MQIDCFNHSSQLTLKGWQINKIYSMDLTTHPLPSQKSMYEAFMHPKASKENSFYVGVLSTGVFNSASCPSKKPLKNNMVFFSSTKEALDYGYRPCLICRPMLKGESVPDYIDELLAEIDHRPMDFISDKDLLVMGIEAATLRKWFLKHHQITFQDYLRYQRINHLFGNILFDSHPSVHRSYHLGEIVHGSDPTDKDGALTNKKIIKINRIDTPIGPMLAGAVDEGICLLEFTDRKILENQLAHIEKHFNAVLSPGESVHFEKLNEELQEYFKGERKEFTVPLAYPGSPFQISVWESLIDIPFGTTRSYKEQSIILQNPKAIRAIAHANGENRIAILIPCHRIIGSNGDLVGYGGGLWRKQFLLDLENPSQFSLAF